MKKAILASLFSTTLLLGSFGVTALADEGVPTEPTDPTVVVPIDPPIEPVDPTTPVEPTEPTEPVEPTEPTEPVEPTEPTNPTTPVEPTEPTKPVEPTEPTTPVEPTEPTEPVKPTEPTKPVEKPTEARPNLSKPAEPAKEVMVTVTSSGQPTSNKSQGTNIPIITSNVDELTYIPTLTTPLKVTSGQAIVGVLDGVPLVQTEQGELVKDSSIPVKKLASGNIEVKTSEGQTKVLPKTGETEHVLLALAGSLVFGVSALGVFLKKRFLA